ncbi:unnamed protein product [Mesocestoides corti]|uniref:DNA polymerase eta n=1 Tax=Mesocestoides corti TaxID=53468 RepID=A0A0R3UFG1_MESCO|nr:unnamed protein product [Mesocestoides corti]
MDRVVFLIDMDCFYVQVEQKMRPETIGLPCAVIQYTSLSSASYVSLYLHFDFNTKEGRFKVYEWYRDAGAEVINSLSKFTSKIERASIDEAYIDSSLVMACTEMISLDSTNYKSNIVFDPSSIEVNAQDFTENDGQKLKSALYLAQQIKRQILEDTSFRCSVGVAANRVSYKLLSQGPIIWHPVRISPGLGGKLGDDVSRRYNIECFGSLTEVPLSTLVADYGEKTGNWLYGLCRGQDHQAVSTRTLVQSIGCSKNFLGKSSLMTDEDIRHWLTLLAGELVERVAIDRGTNNRLPTSLTVHVRFGQTTPITNIGISAGKFRPDHISRCGNVKKLFMKQIGDKRSEDDSADNFSLINAPLQSISSSPSLKPSGRGNTFFQRHEADADTILCEECGSRVLVHLMPEHSDFHFARKIQRQWNQETSGNLENVRSGQTKTKPSSRARGCQRRRPNGRKIQPGTCRSRIDNFFPKNI